MPLLPISPMPDSAEAYFNRGVAYGKKGDLDSAINVFDQAIQFNPNVAEAYSKRRLANNNKGDLVRTINNYDKAIQLNANYADG